MYVHVCMLTIKLMSFIERYRNFKDDNIEIDGFLRKELWSRYSLISLSSIPRHVAKEKARAEWRLAVTTVIEVESMIKVGTKYKMASLKLFTSKT